MSQEKNMWSKSSFGVNILVWLVISSLLSFGPISYAKESPGGSPAKEYFASNPEGRILIKVQVWGDIALSGSHYIPDTATLIDLLGYAGGPNGSLTRTNIILQRHNEKKEIQTTKISGRDILDNPTYSAYKLYNGDIVHIEVESPQKESLMQNLSITSSIVGILMSFVVIYYLIQEKN